MVTSSHLLYQIADIEATQPESKAVIACLSLFRAVAETARKKERNFIELSQPREIEFDN